MFSPAQVLAYNSLEEQYPDHLPPRKLADAEGMVAIFFVIEDVSDQTGCEPECPLEHLSYLIVLPDNAVEAGCPRIGGADPIGERPIISNTFGEQMVYGLPLMEMAEAVESEDWPERVVVDSDSYDPWLDFGVE